MELHEYPRPANDTGIGIHWTPGYATAVGMARIREHWLPELRTLGVKWVKIYNHDGALDLAELLLSEGIVPIVRIYRPTPNPSRLGLREIVHVDSYVRAGVRYFEFNSQPDRDSEWKGGRVPANALELVAEDTIANMEAILERGGMPAVPALTNGSQWDLVGKIVAKGRRDLFDGPVWQAIHNYMRNRPLDYPYDIGNQEGAAYTERFYRTVADEVWEESAWRGRSLNDINRLRLDRCLPGMTIKDDHACWLAFEHFDERNRHHLGRSIPILATESGYLVGEDTDPRYPATTPNLHMAQTLEACRVMMGVSHRFPAAPDYFFCSCFAAIANNQLGGSSVWWEKFAWYSDRWPGGCLPLVRALRAETKVARKWQGRGQSGPLITLRGAVVHATPQQIVILERNGLQIASSALDANSRYELPDLAPGNYTLRVPGTAVEQPVTIAADHTEVVINLDVGAPEDLVSRSVVSGVVAGGAGAVVVLLRPSDGEEWVTIARDDGTFRFIELPPGIYSAQISGEGSRVDTIALDGRNQREIALAVAGWGFTVTTAEEVSGIGAIRCRVRNRKGVSVQAHTFSGSSSPQQTGSDPNLAEDECQLIGLDSGLYIVTASGLPGRDGRSVEAEGRVTVDKRRIPLIEFVYSELADNTMTARSVIRGRVIGGVESGSALRVRLIDARGQAREVDAEPNGGFEFASLGSGAYMLQVVGHEVTSTRSDIALDGVNQVSVELLLPVQPRSATAEQAQGQSVIIGHAPGAAGRLARLVDAVGNEQQQVVSLDEVARFERLSAGMYTLSVEGGYEQANLQVDGSGGLEVVFAGLTASWEALISKAGSMPGYSVVRAEVQGRKHVPVYIWKEGWDGLMKHSGSSPELGEFALEFGQLGPGHYMVEAEGLGVYTDVELSGLEAVWVSFQPRSMPSSPNVVRPLPGSTPSSGAASQPAPGRRVYLWVDELTVSGADLQALLRYVAHVQPEIGADLEQAMRADEVILVETATPSETLAAVERVLAASGVSARRSGVSGL